MPPPKSPMPVRTVLVCILLLLHACGNSLITQEEMQSAVSSYIGRITFAQDYLTSFQLKGSARLCGSNLVARGRFVLWGSASDCLLRGDFYGPDGSPVLSVHGDSTGIIMYFPDDETAVFAPFGMPVGAGTISTEDMIFMLRTGFPLLLEPWVIESGAVTDRDCIRWDFCIMRALDSMALELEPPGLFPACLAWQDGEILITAASPHDEYSAWPSCWEFHSGETEIELALTDIIHPAVPWSGIWDLSVPVHIDTLAVTPLWKPDWNIPVH